MWPKREAIPPETRYDIDLLSGCWNWTGAKDRHGYGRISRTENGQPKMIASHRYFYEQAHGPIGSDQHLDHLCRNPSCVNPAHLEPVSQTENTRRGSAAKLTVAAVKDIRERYAAGDITQRQLADEYGVSAWTISAVLLGKQWTNEIDDLKLSPDNRNRRTGRPPTLSLERQREMITRFDAGERAGALALEYGISAATFTTIRKRVSVSCSLESEVSNGDSSPNPANGVGSGETQPCGLNQGWQESAF